MSDEQSLKSLYADMYQAMIKKDTRSLNQFLHPEFILIHMTGMRQTKKEFIDAVQNGTLNYYSADTEHLNIQIKGNTALVIGDSRVNAAVFGGNRYTWPLEQRLTCIKEDGNWLIKESAASTY